MITESAHSQYALTCFVGQNESRKGLHVDEKWKLGSASLWKIAIWSLVKQNNCNFQQNVYKTINLYKINPELAQCGSSSGARAQSCLTTFSHNRPFSQQACHSRAFHQQWLGSINGPSELCASEPVYTKQGPWNRLTWNECSCSECYL